MQVVESLNANAVKSPRGSLGNKSAPGTTHGRPKGEYTTRHTLLSMYGELPQGDITLEDFESLALDRLRGSN
jgi:hypothetical protein